MDGKLLGGFGKVGRTPAEEKTFKSNWMPLAMVFEKGGKHLLAIRFSNQYAADLNSSSGKLFNGLAPIGFVARLARFGESTNAHKIIILVFLSLKATDIIAQRESLGKVRSNSRSLKASNTNATFVRGFQRRVDDCQRPIVSAKSLHHRL